MKKIFLLSFIIIPFFLSTVPANGQVDEQDLIKKVEDYRAQNNLQEAARYLNQLAFYYWETEKLEKAIVAFEQSVTFNKEIGNENALKGLYSNMGMLYTDMGQPETALVYFRKSLLICKSLNQVQDIGTTLLNIASTLVLLERNDEALTNLNDALVYILQLNNKRMLRSCYNSLAEVHQKLGNSEKSMEYFNMFSAFQKDIQQEEVESEKQKSREQVAQSEIKVKEAIQDKVITEEKLAVTKDSLKVSEEINYQNRMKLQLQTAQLKSQRLLILIFVIGIGFLVILAIIIFWSYRQKKKHNIILEHRNEEIRIQNERINDKNKKINQSINYARNIQGALLPDLDNLKSLFSESFIYFSPRDVVSGDFYWYNTVRHKGKELQIVAAVDCTGHGVPGAFMSMLGLSFLDEIVMDKGIVQPNAILEQMHQLIKASLKQTTSGNTDGMDMTICVYDAADKVLQFAGAANPLVYIQNNELKTIRGDFFGIGGAMKDAAGDKATFTKYEVKVTAPTTFYIFSDGYADQFGGSEGRKYFTKNFRSLLFDIHTKPMEQQKQILESTLLEWLGKEYNRVDDVLVIGFKIQ